MTTQWKDSIRFYHRYDVDTEALVIRWRWLFPGVGPSWKVKGHTWYQDWQTRRFLQLPRMEGAFWLQTFSMDWLFQRFPLLVFVTFRTVQHPPAFAAHRTFKLYYSTPTNFTISIPANAPNWWHSYPRELWPP